VHIAISHVPVEHVSDAFARLQPVPHAPQFDSVVSGVSHPFGAEPSQLPHPEVHAPRVQVPVEQLSAAFGRSHEVPQDPQFVSVESDASQPFASLPSQLPWVELHEATAHIPVAQVAVAFAREHNTPHEPQSASVRSDVSHPFASIESQSP
jgi:hypothetical protein